MVNEFGVRSSISPASELQNNSETNDVTRFMTSVSKRIKLSSQLNQSGGELNSSKQTGLLGLKLHKTPSLLNLVGMVLSQSSTNNDTKQASSSSQDHNETKMNNVSSKPQQVSEKLKASNFQALSLKIGNFEKISRYEEELVAKYYYAKKKIVWELLEGPVKSKIEIQWSDVEAMRAIIHANEPGILEIDLNQPPSFYKETNPQPKKHTIWQPSSDFTNGEALKFRRHSVHFPPRTLDKHYEKLLQCDPRLLELSRKPFPIGGYPYFRPEYYPCNILFDRQQTNIPSSLLVQPHHLNLDAQFQVPNLRQQDGGLNVGMFRNQREENWTRNENFPVWENQTQGLIPSVASNAQREFDPINAFGTANDLMWDKQFAYPDSDNILARGNSMCSFAVTPNGVNDLGIDPPENIQENIGHWGKSQICKYNDGMINSLSSQASDDYLMMMNYYHQYGLPSQKVENYEYLDSSYTDQCDHQWS